MKKTRKVLSLLLTLCMVTSLCPPTLAKELEYTEATPQKQQKQVEFTEATSQKRQKQIEFTEAEPQKRQKQVDETEVSSNKKNTNIQNIISNEDVVNEGTKDTIGVPTTIADGVTFITGTVYDLESEEPLSDIVTVTLYAKGNLDNPLAQCKTDKDGVFKFTGVSAGDYTLELSCSIFFTKYQDATISENSEGYIIDVIYMQEIGYDTWTIIDAVTENPIKGATVALYSKGELITSIKTDENGIASINKLKKGYYDIILSCQGYQTKNFKNELFASIPIPLGRTIKMEPSAGGDNTGGDDKGTRGTCGEHLTWILEDATLTISGTGAMYDYTSLDDVPWNANDVKKVIIEDGVTTVGASAFYSCMNLTQVTLPNSLTEIRESAFGACVNLPEITIPEGVTKIGDSAFYSCNNLEKVTMTESVINIAEGVFGGCSAIKDVYYAGDENQWEDIFIGEDNDFLTNATIHYNSKDTDPDNPDEDKEEITWNLDENGVLTISGKNVVLSRDDLGGLQLENVKTIIINEGIINIDYNIIKDCVNLEEVVLPDSITTIPEEAFEGCSSLTGIRLPDNLINIGDSAFQDCVSLTEITIPNSITSISGWTFEGCSSLTKVALSNNITSIGFLAFSGCNNLTTITLPDSITTIGGSAFSDCSSLREITIPNNVKIGRAHV